ncbi:MAG: hypothetical protein JJU02_01185 [Cryomorphaceae bacterium]|nr:hypothetical protein [Cryomorphaceae bacterium]
MKRHYFLFTLVVCSFSCVCQIGAKGRAMGSNTIGLTDAFSALNNPAASTNVQRNVLITDWENRYMVNKLSQSTVGGIFKVNNDRLGFSLYHTGFSAFSSSDFRLFYAKKISSKFSVATRLNLHHTFIPEQNNNIISISPDIFLHYEVNEKLNFGVNAGNLIPIHSESPSQQLIIGLAYYFSDKLTFTSDCIKIMDAPFSAGIGLEWSIKESLFLRTGLRNQPQINSFGIGYKKESFACDFSFSYIPIIGMSPGLSLSYVW